MNIIDEYRKLTEDIAVIDSKITSASREVKKLIDTYKPAEIKAVDYSSDRVKSSIVVRSLLDVTDDINIFKLEIKKLRSERRNLVAQRKKLDDVVDGLGDSKKKVVMMKICGKTIAEIADEMNYSERQIYRIILPKQYI